MIILNSCTSPVAELCAYKSNKDDKNIYVAIKPLKPSIFNSTVPVIINTKSFEKFLSKVAKECSGCSAPKNKVIAELVSNNQEIILKVIKNHSNTFDVKVYYNFKRPFGAIDTINLTLNDLSVFSKVY